MNARAHPPTSRAIRRKWLVPLLLTAWAMACSLAAHCAAPAEAAAPDITPPAQAGSAASPELAPLADTRSGFIYDHDYPFIDYSGTPRHNDIAHLLARMKAGKVRLTYHEPRGYLDSLLQALGIDPASQVLVFSKTSLQVDLISPQTPRAIYFNDDTYVAWVDNTSLIEIATMDSLMGTVFYTILDRPAEVPQVDRETTRCLSCHDTYSLSGGGVPNFLFLSAYTRTPREIITNEVARQTSDATPLNERWGGWYVTGSTGELAHLGNILPSATGAVPVSAMHPRDLATLQGLFDANLYPTSTSDVVALLILQHQVDIHNLIIHANYKCRSLLARYRQGSWTPASHWNELPSPLQRRFVDLLEPLIRGMLMVNAAPFPHPIRGSSAFARSFEARGPRDAHGRSLRDLDLDTRLFRYSLSFLIYSEGFDYLPVAAKEYVYERLDEILTGRDASPAFAKLPAADRHAIVAILSATKPDFARTVAQQQRERAVTAPSRASS